jgi:hypothetical protein
MNIRSLAFAIAALSSAHITTAAAQSVYVAPGGVYIGGGPVYVTPAPSNGTYVEPTYGYGVPGPVVAPYGLNGNGYGYGNGYGNANGYGNGNYGPPPPAYYNGDPVLSAYGRGRLSDYPVRRPPVAIPYNGSGRCIAGRC